jgi:rhodanese-related sulfurtransferase
MNTQKIGFASLIGVLVTSSILLAACQSKTTSTPIASQELDVKQVQVDGGSYKDVSVQKLHSLLEKKDFVLVNVHVPFEGNLPKTDLSIAYDMIGQNLDKLPGDKNAKIVLYCRSGRMSTIAAEELVKLGYTNIWSLNGGMAAWEQAGQAIER